MRWWALALFMATTLFGSTSLAQNAGMETSGLRDGSLGSGQVRGRQLSDWVVPGQGTTARFYSGCGVELELQLSTTGPNNHVEVAILNTSGEDVVYRPVQTSARIGGIERFLSSLEVNDIEVKDGWWVSVSHRFEAKEAFRDADEIALALSFHRESGPCRFEAKMERDPSVSVSRRTFQRISNVEMLIEGGARLSTWGGIGQLGAQTGFQAGLSFGFYPWGEHGFPLDIYGEGFGKQNVSTFDDSADLDDKARMSATQFFTGYIYKHYFHPNIAVHYGLTGGIYAVQLGTPAEALQSKAFGAVKNRLRLDVVFAPLGEARFALSPSVYHLVLPHASFAGVDISGHSLGVGLALVMTD